MHTTAVLLLSCPDRPGVVAAVADFVYRHGGNIVDAQQHTDRTDNVFFQRVEFSLDDCDLARDEIGPSLSPLVERFGMECRVRFSDEVPRIGVLVSREAHCLVDLLARCARGELPIEIPVVISNHADHAEVAEWFGIDFVHLPVTPDTKPTQEAAMHAVLSEHGVDARGARPLHADPERRVRGEMARRHHQHPPFVPPRVHGWSSVPPGARAGVKIVGVTAHYAPWCSTTGRSSTRTSSASAIATPSKTCNVAGRDLEVVVLARTVRAHVEHRVLVHGRRTVVFD